MSIPNGSVLPGGAGWTEPTWSTPEDIRDRALAILRLPSTHPDAERILSSARTAIDLVDDYLDRADDPLRVPPPDPVLDSTVIVCIEAYRRKDAPFGVLNSWSDSDIGPLRIGTDPLKGVEQMLMPYSHRYGVR